MLSPEKQAEYASSFVANPFIAVAEFQKLVDRFDELFYTTFGGPIMPEDVHGCIPVQGAGDVEHPMFSFSIMKFYEAAEFAAHERPEFFSRIDIAALQAWKQSIDDFRIYLPANETGSYVHCDLFEDLYLKNCAVLCNLQSFSEFVHFKWIQHQRKQEADKLQRGGDGSIESVPPAASENPKNGGTGELGDVPSGADAEVAGQKKTKRKSPGEGDELLKAYLRHHHRYRTGAEPDDLNMQPAASSEEISKKLKISAGSVSDFFKEKFESRKHYNDVCIRGDFGELLLSLKLMSGDMAPPQLRKQLKAELNIAKHDDGNDDGDDFD